MSKSDSNDQYFLYFLSVNGSCFLMMTEEIDRVYLLAQENKLFSQGKIIEVDKNDWRAGFTCCFHFGRDILFLPYCSNQLLRFNGAENTFSTTSHVKISFGLEKLQKIEKETFTGRIRTILAERGILQEAECQLNDFIGLVADT